MSMKGCCAIDSVWPLKLQNTWLSGYCPFVWFTIETSSTWVAAGMALTLPQKEAGGRPPDPPPRPFTGPPNGADPAAPVLSRARTGRVGALGRGGRAWVRRGAEW